MTIISAVDPILITINELVTGPSRHIWLKSSSQSAETRKVYILVYTHSNIYLYTILTISDIGVPSPICTSK